MINKIEYFMSITGNTSKFPKEYTGIKYENIKVGDTFGLEVVKIGLKKRKPVIYFQLKLIKGELK